MNQAFIVQEAVVLVKEVEKVCVPIAGNGIRQEIRGRERTVLWVRLLNASSPLKNWIPAMPLQKGS